MSGSKTPFHLVLFQLVKFTAIKQVHVQRKEIRWSTEFLLSLFKYLLRMVVIDLIKTWGSWQDGRRTIFKSPKQEGVVLCILTDLHPEPFSVKEDILKKYAYSCENHSCCHGWGTFWSCSRWEDTWVDIRENSVTGFKKKHF